MTHRHLWGGSTSCYGVPCGGVDTQNPQRPIKNHQIFGRLMFPLQAAVVASKAFLLATPAPLHARPLRAIAIAGVARGNGHILLRQAGSWRTWQRYTQPRKSRRRNKLEFPNGNATPGGGVPWQRSGSHGCRNLSISSGTEPQKKRSMKKRT